MHSVRLPKDRRLPVVLTRPQVRSLIDGARLFHFRVFFQLCYSCGLRLSDATQMWVWYRMKGGLAIPIGKARALPSRETATLEVYQWNTRDKDAKAVIDQLGARLDWMQDKAGDREGIFATTAGLPIPPGWDPARAQYEDEKKNG